MPTTLSEFLDEALKEKEKEDLQEKKRKTMSEKRCSRKTCLKSYPSTFEFFGKNKGAKDGLTYYCKECIRKVANKAYRKKVGDLTYKQNVKNPKTNNYRKNDITLPDPCNTCIAKYWSICCNRCKNCSYFEIKKSNEIDFDNLVPDSGPVPI